ncbi:MAG: TonB family protein [Cyclobacteriaceae bacterium]|nr:TonB family protein [Cyclobacteriaceae bacterium]
MVVDSETNNPIQNVSVIIEGTKFGTTTNKTGYFQLDLAKGSTALKVSHIGYKSGTIFIPEVNVFKIALDPEPRILKAIELIDFPKTPINEDSKNYKVFSQDEIVKEQDAEYKGGWFKFFTDLGNSIVQDSLFIAEEFDLKLLFRVNHQGVLDSLHAFQDSTINKAIIFSAFEKLDSFHPAIQNTPTEQYFGIHINYTDKEENRNVTDITDITEFAMPKGGYAEFYKFIAINLSYPAEARKRGIEGRVFIEFTVQEDGSLSNIKTAKGIGGGCDEEAVRVVSLAKNWDPPKKDGQPTTQNVVLPITFKLAGFQENKKDYKIVEKDSGVVITAHGIVREKATIGLPYFSEAVRPAHFPGGEKAFTIFMKDHKREIESELPPNNQNDHVQLQLQIDELGYINDVKVIKGLSKEFDDEAIRLYSIMPRWEPEIKNIKPVPSTKVVYVDFSKVSLSKKQSSAYSFSKANELSINGKLEKSLNSYGKAIEGYPSNLNYYFNRAAIYFKLNQTTEGCKDLLYIKPYDQEALELYKKLCD